MVKMFSKIANGQIKINKKTLYQCTCRLLNAWITVYPLFLIPSCLCRKALEIYNQTTTDNGLL